MLSQVSTDTDYSLCFGCGQNNPIGLKLRFQWDGKTASAKFTPAENYQGWPGMVHGGILICLLDEAVSYAVLFEGNASVTAKIEAKLRRPAPINETLIITSSVIKKRKKLFQSQATISLEDGTLIAEGVATQFVVNPPSKEDKPIIEKGV